MFRHALRRRPQFGPAGENFEIRGLFSRKSLRELAFRPGSRAPKTGFLGHPFVKRQNGFCSFWRAAGPCLDEGTLVGALFAAILAIPATQNVFWVAGMAKMHAFNAPTSIPSSPGSAFGARSAFPQGRGFAPTPWDCSGAGAPPPRSVPRAVHSPRWQYPASCQRDARLPERGIHGAVCSE